MSRVTKFAGRDPGVAARVAGFIAHLRENGLRLGVAEAEDAATSDGASAPSGCAGGEARAAVPLEESAVAKRALFNACAS